MRFTLSSSSKRKCMTRSRWIPHLEVLLLAFPSVSAAQATSATPLSPSSVVSAAIDDNTNSRLVIPFEVIGFVRRSGTWQAIARNLPKGEIIFLSEGDMAFGYRFKKLSVDSKSVVLENAGKEYELKAGAASPPADAVVHITPPRLIEEWIAQIQ